MKTIHRGYKFRIYPNQEQKIQIAKTFGCVRFVYNYYLAMREKMYKEQDIRMSKIDYNNHCNNVLKNEYPWLREPCKHAIVNSIFNLDAAFKRFFNKESEYPKFKSKKTNEFSYTSSYSNKNIESEHNKIKIPKLGWIKAKTHRQFSGQIKSATVSQDPSGKYFCSLLVVEEIQELPQKENIIAFDLGLKGFIINQYNEEEENPRYYRKYEKKLAKLQKKHSRKQKGSKNRNKSRVKIARLHEKIANIRKDFLHNLSYRIINENQVIISEDLAVKNMMRNHKLAKSIADASWSEFTRQLSYKATWHDRIYHKVDRFFASSQICNSCGYKNPEVKKPAIRKWECPECKSQNERDGNAAQNILERGLQDLNMQYA